MCIRDSIQGVGISQQMFDHFNSLSSTLKSIQDELCKVMRDIRHNREDISELQQVHDILEQKFESFDTTLREENVVVLDVYEPTVWDGYNDTDEIVVLLKSNTGITNWSHADIEHNE
eukprot:TRINITY_DN41069_c1_g1_i2.p1 TRINITY_DN41069_c1_g1~~TRINITY_DN41069_c1_g1_i2.p1  ORF type:complete len:117 (+),score=22.89 TRINITY_DN41069_c1_g1_i2:1-351(+)